MLHEKTVDSQCIGNIQIPTSNGKGGDTIPINVNPEQLKRIHLLFVS